LAEDGGFYWMSINTAAPEFTRCAPSDAHERKRLEQAGLEIILDMRNWMIANCPGQS
jgi:hypothetical protein